MDALNLSKDDAILKSCPFCNSGETSMYEDHNSFVIEHWCRNQGRSSKKVTVLGATLEAAIDDWNRRHDETPSEFERCMK
ncbi:hypothetical protein CN085_19630 [Sinorhizobium meliloti]|uniref:hypothetical protein n=1 Tax=Rhizobium meliloti TaxID=382 RepID=UPI000FDA8E9A|nr:hypothetical protein [Sinorhizobium meliloti]RVP13125.1 hypothetical protein CN085_19630 [Sinorhizobium meliloti]